MKRELDILNDDGGSTTIRDVLMLTLAGFITLLLLVLPYINPKTIVADPSTVPGNLIVELRWPDEINADVDLWVQAPDDRPVGYSNKSSQVFDLLRDDLGNSSDMTGLNYEFAYSRGAPPGEYVVNAHLYRNKQNVFPIPITVVVSLKSATDAASKQILVGKELLRHVGQELTLFRFALDQNSKFVPGSEYQLPKSLRAPS